MQAFFHDLRYALKNLPFPDPERNDRRAEGGVGA